MSDDAITQDGIFLGSPFFIFLTLMFALTDILILLRANFYGYSDNAWVLGKQCSHLSLSKFSKEGKYAILINKALKTVLTKE